MTLLRVLAILLGLLAVSAASMAGPVDGPKVFKAESIGPDSPFVQTMKFKGGVRAGVMVRGDLKSKADIFIEIFDAQNQLITQDKGGGDFASVIWYPPQEAAFKIKITVKSAHTIPCYIAVR